MNWDAIGAIGEMIGASAVVISVVYLALQIRKQTHESRLAATRELNNQNVQSQTVITENAEIASIYLKAVRDYESLPDLDRLRISLQFQRNFRMLEQQFLHIKSGNVEASYLESVNKAYREWLVFPGVKQWWKLSKHHFDSGFCAYIEQEMQAGEQEEYASTFQLNRQKNQSVILLSRPK